MPYLHRSFSLKEPYNWLVVQGGKDPQDALRCGSFFAKEPLIIGLFCGKCPMKIRHLMTLRHPVRVDIYGVCTNIQI